MGVCQPLWSVKNKPYNVKAQYSREGCQVKRERSQLLLLWSHSSCLHVEVLQNGKLKPTGWEKCFKDTVTTWLNLVESPSGLFPPQCTLPPSNRRGRDAFQIWNGHRGWCLVSIGCPITQRPVITLHVQHKPSFQGFPCCRNYHTQRNSFRGKQWLGGLGLGPPPLDVASPCKAAFRWDGV